MRTNGHAHVETRIGRDLDAALGRLRQLGGTAVGQELSGTVGESSMFADEVDQIQVSASRDIGLATRELLQGLVNRLSAALDRLNDGAYGVCTECAEPIAAARLHALPEVQTCVRCQAGIERLGRPAASSRHSVFAVDNDETATSDAALPSYRSSLFPNEEDRSAL
jgi:DnaK suppressor protein